MTLSARLRPGQQETDMKYSVNTTSRSFETKTASAAARIAVDWKARGMEPSAWTTWIDDAEGVKSIETPITTITQTAADLVAAAR